MASFWRSISSIEKLRPPRSCQTIDSCVTIVSSSRRLRLQSISLKRRSLRRSVGRPAEQALDRRQSTNDCSAVSSTLVPIGWTSSVAASECAGKQRLRRRPRDLRGVDRLELDRGPQLGRQPGRRRQAEGVDRTGDPPLVVGGELRRPREVDGAQALLRRGAPCDGLGDLAGLGRLEQRGDLVRVHLVVHEFAPEKRGSVIGLPRRPLRRCREAGLRRACTGAERQQRGALAACELRGHVAADARPARSGRGCRRSPRRGPRSRGWSRCSLDRGGVAGADVEARADREHPRAADSTASSRRLTAPARSSCETSSGTAGSANLPAGPLAPLRLGQHDVRETGDAGLLVDQRQADARARGRSRRAHRRPSWRPRALPSARSP